MALQNSPIIGKNSKKYDDQRTLMLMQNNKVVFYQNMTEAPL